MVLKYYTYIYFLKIDESDDVLTTQPKKKQRKLKSIDDLSSKHMINETNTLLFFVIEICFVR